MALAAGLSSASVSSAAAAPVREIWGSGLDACPQESLCLYQNDDFNGSSDARIWIVTGDVGNLSTYDANDRATSVYYNASHGSATLYANKHYNNGNLDDMLRLSGGDRYADLHESLPGLHGSDDDGERPATVKMNDRISSVTFSTF
ncbi:hypothetical protein A8W25_24895 [Streptomyces sp. ERV7]|nr:hypothetical protein A8W25_24895 [Streptomyces sp. ERV7]